MRQLLLQVPSGQGEEVLTRTSHLETTNALIVPGRTSEDDRDLVFLHVPNDAVDDVVTAVQAITEVHATIHPQGVLTLSPPPEEPPDPLLDTSPRAPIEILLAGLQSAGSWPAFLAYSLLSGIVVWIGLYGGVWYLLTAAMLIAPFAGPAINTAIASATGRPGLLRHSVARYLGGIATGAVAAALLTLIARQRVATELMVAVTDLSLVYVLLPLAAGAAGALYLTTSEHSSLVSGAAVGMLVAASLAPPTGVLGSALVIGRMDLVGRTVFLIVLQLAGINLVASGVFRLYGLRPERERFGTGSRRALSVALATSALLVVGMVGWQTVATGTWGQRQDLAVAAVAHIQDAADGMDGVTLLDTDVRHGRFASDHLIASVTVSTEPGRTADVETTLTSLLRETLARQGVPVVVDLTVLDDAP